MWNRQIPCHITGRPGAARVHGSTRREILQAISSDTVYVMWSSNMSRNSQILFLKYSRTKPIGSFVYCLLNPSTACIFGTNCPISVGFSPNQSLNNTLIENAKKTKIVFFDFRLILLDRITYSLRWYPFMNNNTMPAKSALSNAKFACVNINH